MDNMKAVAQALMQPTPSPDDLGLPKSAQQGQIVMGKDGRRYQYVQKTGGTDGVGSWGWEQRA